MATETYFIEENVKHLEVKKFLQKELATIGWGRIYVNKTPLGVRVQIHSTKPGLVIGHKGSTIQNLTRALKEKYKLDNPQIEVKQIEVPEFNAMAMAQSVASALERGIQFRRAAYSAVKQIMGAGAQGVEIRIAGKITGERAKAEKFKSGFILHTGDMKYDVVEDAQVQAKLKPGVLGVRVRLVPPQYSVTAIKYKVLDAKKEEKPAEAKPAEAVAVAEVKAEAVPEAAPEAKAEEKEEVKEEAEKKKPSKKSKKEEDLVSDLPIQIIEEEIPGDEA